MINIISSLIFSKKYWHKNPRGFSLLEVLIYVSILSILVVVVSNIFISLSRGSGQSQAKNEVNSSISFVNELIKQDIKNASVISIPVSGGSSNTLSLVRGGLVVVYDVSGGYLRRKEGSAVPVNITNSNIIVGEPNFIRVENTNLVFNTTSISIQVIITFSYNSTSPDWSYSSSLQTTVSLSDNFNQSSSSY